MHDLTSLSCPFHRNGQLPYEEGMGVGGERLRGRHLGTEVTKPNTKEETTQPRRGRVTPSLHKPQEHKGTRVQGYKSTRVQEYKDTRVQGTG
ncbi:MAG: hypothetical protein MJA30_27770 [Cytophagales bacterium]|nr:hypothetical protein [Cytophagales bacterium]